MTSTIRCFSSLRVGRSSIEQHPPQLLIADGLHEVKVEAGFPGTALVALLSPSSHGHQPQLLAFRQAAQAACDFVSVEHGHTDVEHHDLGPPLLNLRERTGAI